MENGFGPTIIQVDNEPAILQLAQEAAQKHSNPWRQSCSHAHQGQGAAVERFHKTLFAQCHEIRFDLIERYNLQSPENVPEQLLPWVLYNMLASQSTAICTLVRSSWLTSSTYQSTSLPSGKMDKKSKAFGWGRQPTVVNTLSPQRGTSARSSTQGA
eukprot:850891-Amphidinium_carterae.1